MLEPTFFGSLTFPTPQKHTMKKKNVEAYQNKKENGKKHPPQDGIPAATGVQEHLPSRQLRESRCRVFRVGVRPGRVRQEDPGPIS